MAATTTVAQMNGLYKEAYADGIVGLIPDVAYLIKNIGFSEAEKIGNYYHQPVTLTRENGITYAGAGAGAYALNTAIAMTMKDATVQGSQMTLRSAIPYDTVARSVGSAKAFRKADLGHHREQPRIAHQAARTRGAVRPQPARRHQRVHQHQRHRDHAHHHRGLLGRRDVGRGGGLEAPHHHLCRRRARHR